MQGENTPKAPISAYSHPFPVADLARSAGSKLNIIPERPALDAIASDLGLLALRKVSLVGTLKPLGKRDWQLNAHLGATVEQACSVTLAPVTTRLEENISRIWRAQMPDTADMANEVEMPEDTSQEQLGRIIDLGQVLSEALALALPLYPRASEATLSEANFAAPGVTPMRDEDTRPFAGLAGLRDKLTGTTDDDDNGDGSSENG